MPWKLQLSFPPDFQRLSTAIGNLYYHQHYYHLIMLTLWFWRPGRGSEPQRTPARRERCAGRASSRPRHGPTEVSQTWWTWSAPPLGQICWAEKYYSKFGYNMTLFLSQHLGWTQRCCSNTIHPNSHSPTANHIQRPCCQKDRGYLLSRGLNTDCFALSSLIKPPSTCQNFFTFTLLPSSSALLQTAEYSEYHPSTVSPVVSTLSLTRLQLPGTSSPFLSAILPLTALSNLLWKPFAFQKHFLRSHCPDNIRKWL